jgi:tetratricopeptide (TPR) repeat protein
MSRHLLVASAVALLPAPALAYINAGFKSQAEYNQYMRQQRVAKIARATEAIRRDPRDAMAYFYRGNVYAEHNGAGDYHDGGPDYKRALADYDRAIGLDPVFAHAYFRRGKIRFQLLVDQLNQTPEMREAWRLPLPARRARVRALKNTPQRRRQEAEVLADVEMAVRLKPDLVEAQVFLAANTRDVAKAIRAAKRACKHTGYKNDGCLQLLAARYADNSDFANAVRWQEKALKLPIFPSFYADSAKRRLENYRQKKPNEWWDTRLIPVRLK